MEAKREEKECTKGKVRKKRKGESKGAEEKLMRKKGGVANGKKGAKNREKG